MEVFGRKREVGERERDDLDRVDSIEIGEEGIERSYLE